MSEFRDSLGRVRPPTWFERDLLAGRREQAAADVLLEPDQTPQAFWETVVQATTYHLMDATASHLWDDWEREFRWMLGLPELALEPWPTYDRLIRAQMIHHGGEWIRAALAVRLSAIEIAMDTASQR